MLPPVIIFLLGLAVGSFINALVYRLQAQKPWIRARSICPNCRHKLAWSDLIPLASFILLKGRCQYCRQKISWHYPLVELATGILFVIIANHQNVGQGTPAISDQPALSGVEGWLVTVLNLFILAILIFVFVYDLKHYLILDKIILPAILVVLVVNLVLGKSWSNMLIAALTVTLFFLLQFLISKGRWLGGGDLRLGFFMGVVLGWPLVLVALFLAYILGSAIGLLLVLFKIKKWRSKIPFAAFLAPATLIALLWGQELLNWYLTLF